MGFIKFIPFGQKTPEDIETTTSPEIQLWAEFSILRHLTGSSAIYGKKVTAPWIDQAKTYFTDACQSSWKSSGLLYYYSFLNLAKALIVKNRSMTGVLLRSTNVYHGLSADMQAPKSIVDFAINIHPAIHRGKKNIFAVLYKNITGSPWPFDNTVSIKLSEVINYCYEISHEVRCFYNTHKECIQAQSLIRDVNNHWWFEMIIHDSFVTKVQNILGDKTYEIVPFTNMTNNDKSEWMLAHKRTVNSLNNHSFFRLSNLPYSQQNRDTIFRTMINYTIETYKNHICPQPFSHYFEDYWNLIPELQTNGLRILWKPILSDYLFAFILSSILRYQPHFFDINQKDAFIAEAWCSQSAITTLRYFLMEFTSPPLRLN